MHLFIYCEVEEFNSMFQICSQIMYSSYMKNCSVGAKAVFFDSGEVRLF